MRVWNGYRPKCYAQKWSLILFVVAIYKEMSFLSPSLSLDDSIGLQVGKPPSHWESLRLPISPGMILKPWFTLQAKFQMTNIETLFE